MSETNEIKSRINCVREIMKKNSVDLYIVCTGDYHLSEYSGEYFAEREYMTGFTGSAGTFVLSQNEAVLFTDGRYFIQAEKQLEGTEIKLMRMGCTGVATLTEYCADNIPENGTVGIDGRTADMQLGIELERAVKNKKGKINSKINFVSKIWKDRPGFPCSNVYSIECGEDVNSKIERLRKAMNKCGAHTHIISTLDDICWLFNLRGSDVMCNPVTMSYAMINEEKVVLYIDKNKLPENIYNNLCFHSVTIRPYEEVYEAASCIEKKSMPVLIDPKRTNYYMYNLLKENNIDMIFDMAPSVRMKAVKNEVEIENLKSVHIDDGLALTKFIFWIKEQMKENKKVTEVQAAEYLDNLRSEIPDYIDLSFETICAYAGNAAMMHYHATKDDCCELQAEGILLVDSGGQYLRGTTDVTRTIALGPVSEQMKKYYTLTLKGMLALADAHFLYGCTGFNLDILARQPLWNEDMDYRCGTGHGIGYLLNVHEAPNGFRWKHVPGHNDLCVMEPGMVTSDEPGVYIDGQFGIRIENEILCKKNSENEYGTWLSFDTLTLAPVDMELVDIKYFEKTDIRRLYKYQKKVFDSLAPRMNKDEIKMLKRETRLEELEMLTK